MSRRNLIQTEKKPVAGFPEDAIDTHSKRVAVGDFLTRIAAGVIREKHMDESISGGSGWSGPKGGSFNINAPGQEILLRSSCVFDTTQGTVELRFTVTLPARGRTVMGQEAYTILITNLPTLVSSALLYRNLKAQDLALHVKKMLDQQTLRSQLATHGLVAFVGNGSILPRQSGAASLPMNSPDIVRFKAPPELEITLLDSSGSSVMGMGVPRGITVLTGGGFHGKSTLLEAIQMSVYDHIPGDGREAIVADPTAFKIRAEDGRSVSNLDISPFISSLPGGKDSARFSSEDASGSTSMAANIQEALELGCKTLLIDEDSSATNLLVRDQRMQALIQAEPITPFVSKARALFEQHGISTVIVVGGCGDYLSVADTVIGMRSYLPHSLTTSARRIVQQYPTSIIQSPDYGALPHRQLSIPKSVLGSKPPAVRGTHFLRLFSAPKNVVANPAESETGIDLSGVEQLVEPGQVRLVAEVLRWLSRDEGSKRSVRDSIDLLDRIFGDGGLDGVVREGHAWGDLVAARRLEVGAAINRLRGCRMSQ